MNTVYDRVRPLILASSLVVAAALTIAGCQARDNERVTTRESSAATPIGEGASRPDVNPSPDRRRKIDVDVHPDDFEGEVQSVIPIGMSVAEARAIMEGNGFKCEMQNGSDGRPGLLCLRSKPMGLLVSWEWKVWIGFENDKVTDVGASSCGLGP